MCRSVQAVSFSYDSDLYQREEIAQKEIDKTIFKDALHNVSLTFAEGKKTAIVGHSGSGKSTIAHLMSRFWDVTSGNITIGGVDYTTIPLAQLMEHVSYVTQDTFFST